MLSTSSCVNDWWSGSAPSGCSAARNQSACTVVIPSSAAPRMSSKSRSPTKSACSGSTSSASNARSKIAGCGACRARHPALEDRGVGFAPPAPGGEDVEVEPVGETHLLEVMVQQPARIERVRDEPQLEPKLAQRLQQRVRVGSEHARRIPGAVLGLEEAPELRVVHLDLEVAQKPEHELRVLDLLDRPRRPEQRLVLF